MIERQGKGVTLIENDPDLLAEQDNLFNNGIGVFLQEFIQNLALFGRQVLFIGKQQITMVPQFLVQGFSDLDLGWLGHGGLEGFAVDGQSFVQMAVDILDGVKKVILDMGVRINGFDRRRISQPKIDVKDLDPQA